VWGAGWRGRTSSMQTKWSTQGSSSRKNTHKESIRHGRPNERTCPHTHTRMRISRGSCVLCPPPVFEVRAAKTAPVSVHTTASWRRSDRDNSTAPTASFLTNSLRSHQRLDQPRESSFACSPPPWPSAMQNGTRRQRRVLQCWWPRHCSGTFSVRWVWGTYRCSRTSHSAERWPSPPHLSNSRFTLADFFSAQSVAEVASLRENLSLVRGP
jgi:hypothetical protein